MSLKQEIFFFPCLAGRTMLNRISLFLSEYVFNTEVRRGPIVLCQSEKLTDVTYTGAPSSHIYAVDSNRFYLIVVMLHHTYVCVLSFIHQPSNLVMLPYCIILPSAH